MTLISERLAPAPSHPPQEKLTGGQAPSLISEKETLVETVETDPRSSPLRIPGAELDNPNSGVIYVVSQNTTEIFPILLSGQVKQGRGTIFLSSVSSSKQQEGTIKFAKKNRKKNPDKIRRRARRKIKKRRRKGKGKQPSY